MTIQEFIKANRVEITQVIRSRESNLGKLNDEDREDWVMNDESLYLWAKASGCKI